MNAIATPTPSARPLSPLPLAAPQDATCAKHPEVTALGTCQRCGTFVCAQDYKLVELKVYCAECAVRPEVDYLEAYRLKYWGKRDGWAWLFGLGGVLNIGLALSLVLAAVIKAAELSLSLLDLAAVVLLMGLNGVLFWAGLPFTRAGVVVGIVVLGLFNVVAQGAQAVSGLVLPLAVALSALGSTRNKLFFKLDVSRAELKKAWDTFHNNTIARNATTLGVGGLLIPVFAPFAIGCGIVGLRRVNPHALPPIGNKGRAIAGIVLGVVGLLLWAGLGLLMWLGKR